MNAKRDRGLIVIAVFKLIKAALLLALAVGAISLLHKDVAEVVTYRIGEIGVDPQGRYIQHLIEKLGFIGPHEVKLISLGSLLYAMLFGTEGIGLLLQKRWAEYLTVITTASFLPLEFYELTRHVALSKMLVMATNIVIVLYLIWQLRKTALRNSTPNNITV